MVGVLGGIVAIGTGVGPNLSAFGALSATIKPVIPLSATFSGGGIVGSRMDRATPVAWTGGGSLTASIGQIYVNASAFSGDGTFVGAQFYGTGFKNMDAAGTGSLSVTTLAMPFVYPALAGNGLLAALLGMQYQFVPTLVGSGVLSALNKQVYGIAAVLSGAGSLTGTDSQIYTQAPALGSTGQLTATAVNPFTPFSLENTNVSGDSVPAGTIGCWLTMLGGGGNGGRGGFSTSGASTGGVGGGGGARAGRFFVDVSLMGSTYSITRGAANGGNSIFSSGSITITAGGGVVAGANGTVTFTGLSPITPWSGDGGTNGSGGEGGHGGNRTQSGGNNVGGAGVAASGGTPTGLNGGGGRGGNSGATGNTGGAGTAYGGGGGGGGAGNSSGGGGGVGAAGYTLIEWQ